MKIFCGILFVLCSFSLVSPFHELHSGTILSNPVSKVVNNDLPREKNGSQVVLDVIAGPIVFDDFELIEGLEIMTWKQKRFIQLGEGAKYGKAEKYFFDQTAKYNITLFYIDESNGKSSVDVLVNDQRTGHFKFDIYKAGNGQSDYFTSSKEKTISGINIQEGSKITLKFYSDGDEKCRIDKLVFTPAGTFDGKIEKLSNPDDLEIYRTSKERLTGRRIFTDFVRSHIDSLVKERLSELSGLKSPAGWKERQKKIRERLTGIYGEFPVRTPLNARITGKIEHDLYTIEKVIFESQPGYYVTANLYVPKNRRFPVPGVVFPCGHSDDAKAFDEYHKTGLGLVLKGYVVFIFDPMGQGERSEYIDPATGKNLVTFGVEQHHYVMQPAFLLDWTLSGLRIWDGIRAVDYLISRPEVDRNKLASVGQSGGGQMSLLITAVDERIKVCVASHPGGSCENSNLLSQNSIIENEVQSLIPPRPLRIIVGKDSGEEQNHRKDLEDMQLFYAGFKADKQCSDLVIVPGVHSMDKNNREAAYEWLNKWFDKEAEGKAEALLEPEKTETLRCTERGNTILSLGGETGQSLNAKRLDRIYKSERNSAKLKEHVAARVGLVLSQNRPLPEVNLVDSLTIEDISIEKLTYVSEKGIFVPALLLKPKIVKPRSPVYFCVSDKGKPNRFDKSAIPFVLAKNGFIVFTIDVRGIGETSPTPPLGLNRFVGYTPLLWQHDILAIQSVTFGRTTLGMRTFDVIRGIDLLNCRDDIKERKIVMLGEGLGGLWAMLAAIYDSRIEGVVSVGTLPSYKPLITNKYYYAWGYFWVPGALRDFDIPDLSRLASPKPQIWIDPVNALGEKLDFKTASSIIGSNINLHIATPDNNSSKDIIGLINLISD